MPILKCPDCDSRLERYVKNGQTSAEWWKCTGPYICVGTLYKRCSDCKDLTAKYNFCREGHCYECCSCINCDSCGDKVDDLCSECDVCENCCYCVRCTECGIEFDGDFLQCEECNLCADCCSCGYGSAVPGWEARGEKITSDFSPIDHSIWATVDPCQAMADFYLLSYMSLRPETSTYAEFDRSWDAIGDVVKSAQNALVSQLDPIFRLYISSAVGGELRYHRNVKHITLPSKRESAWDTWQGIVATLGPQAYLDAADLFIDMGEHGYGGKTWAKVSKILHLRETGQIPPFVFVDRVFTLEHNNGSVLNKVKWGCFSRLHLKPNYNGCKVVGDAQAFEPGPDLPVLLAVCSTKISGIFRQWWIARNRVAVANGQQSEPYPRWQQWLSSRGEFKTSTARFTQYIPFSHCSSCGKWEGQNNKCDPCALTRHEHREKVKTHGGYAYFDYE